MKVFNLMGTCLWMVAMSFGWLSLSTDSIILNGRCGFPGKPYRSKADADFKGHYDEGEEVAYQCVDYRNYLQVRRCVHGRWSGPPARCADVLRWVWLRDVQIEDVSVPHHPRLVQSVQNLNLTLGVWRFPNAFLNSRSPDVKFMLHNDHLYRWRLVFNDTFSKPFVHINFNVHKYSELAPATKARAQLNVSLDVGPERTCFLAAQTYDIWKLSGRKVENYFECDARSHRDYLAEAKSPTNEMIMYTRSSINITYELIAVLLGRQFGTTNEPVCGEPEYAISHVAHFNQEFRDYSYICKKGFEYKAVADETKLSDTSVHFQRCQADMFWEGKYPVCVPKVFCSIEELRRNDDPKRTIDTSVEVYQLDGLYFVNESRYYAIEGTTATYGCANATQAILLGKETRQCNKNGTWSGAKPTCQDPNKASYTLLILTIIGSSFLVLVMIILIFLLITRRFKQRIMATIETQNAQTQAVKELMGIYDNPDIDLAGEGTYANYEYISEYNKLNEASTGMPFGDEGQGTTTAARYNVYHAPAHAATLYDSYIDLAKDRPRQSDYYVTRQEVGPSRTTDDSYLPLVAPWPKSHQDYEGLVRPASPPAAPEEVAYLEMVATEATPKRQKSPKASRPSSPQLNSFEMNSLASKSSQVAEAETYQNYLPEHEASRPEPKKRAKQRSQSAKLTKNEDESIYENYQ